MDAWAAACMPDLSTAWVHGLLYACQGQALHGCMGCCMHARAKHRMGAWAAVCMPGPSTAWVHGLLNACKG
eukprot:362776-Chlamydomonas_euryale.AAC.11